MSYDLHVTSGAQSNIVLYLLFLQFGRTFYIKNTVTLADQGSKPRYFGRPGLESSEYLLFY